MSPKHILVLTDWYEPGYKAGGPIQSTRNFVAAMQGLYSVSVITTDTDLGETHPYPDIPANQWIERSPGIRIYYASRKTLTTAHIKELIESAKPDFIYLNSMYSVPFTIKPLILLWRKKMMVPVILSPRGMLRESAIRLKSTKKKLFISLLRRMHIPEKIRFHATDEQERKDILRYFPRALSVQMIPNFSAGLPPVSQPPEKIPGHLRCVYISRILGIKNILFFLQLLKQVPESILLEFSIYGDIEETAYWAESQKMIRTLPGNITVTYGGSLPHAQVIPAIQAHHIFVLPTKGENFGHAIFESLSAGRPVMISDKTPWLGLREKEAGWDLSLDVSSGWLSAIQEAAGFDQPEFDKWVLNCRKFAKEHQENPVLRERYVQLFS